MKDRQLVAAALTGHAGTTQQKTVFLVAYVLATAGAILIGAALQRRPSRHEFALALSLVRSAPVPVAAGPGPNPQRAGRRGRDRPLAHELADWSMWATVDAAVAWASAAGKAWPYALLLGRKTVTVLLAGGPAAEPPPRWRAVGGGWAVARDHVVTTGDNEAGEGARASDTFVVLGSRGDDAVLLDLACAPGIVTVNGDPHASRDLMASLTAQLAAAPRNRVLVAARVLPGAPGAGLTELLDRIDRHGADSRGVAEAPSTFLICADPAPAEAVRLRSLAARDHRLRALVLGDLTGSRWPLQVDAGGEVIADGLGLVASTRSLPRDVPDRPLPLRAAEQKSH
jgi:hypothetical protein